MKKVVIFLLCLAALRPAHAQLLHPEAVEGAFLGAFIGGLAGGNHCHGFSGESAAIGAGVGLLAGSLIGESRRNDYYETPGYVYTTSPSVNVSFGYGYGSCGSSVYVQYAPNRYCAPGTYYRPTRPNYVVSGTVLGAASGALIGSASDHAGEGAAIGAATGLVLGSVAETTAQGGTRAITAQASNASIAPTKTEISSQPGATATCTWTTRPQIADAPRVPDAPTF
jgi:uncharacterized protein YcfJ